MAEQERSAQETLNALEQKRQRSLFNPFGATATELQVAMAAVRLVQSDRAALEMTMQRLEEEERDRSSESGEWERQLETLEEQEIPTLPVDELPSNSMVNSPAVIPDRTLEVQVFLNEIQSRLDRAARQILDDIGTTSGSRKRFAEVGRYRITEQDGELWIQISGASDVLPRSILQKGELVQGLKKSDLENLEHNAQRVREVLQGQVHQTGRQRDRGRGRE